MIEQDQQAASDAIIKLERQRPVLLLTPNRENEIAMLDRDIAWLGNKLDNLAYTELDLLSRIEGLDGRERDAVTVCVVGSSPTC